MTEKQPLQVAVLSGSPSDGELVEACCAVLGDYGIAHESRVLSAHRRPEALHEYIAEAEERGCRIFIAMAGMAAHLPGVVASLTARPVLGVPLKGGVLEPYSAVVETHGLNPRAVRVMAEAGVDIAGHRSKHVDELADVPRALVSHSGSPKKAVAPTDVYGAECLLERCPPGVVYVVRIDRQGPSVRRMALGEALRCVSEAHIFIGGQKMERTSVDVLCGLLTRTPVYELSTGPDPAGLGAWLARNAGRHAADS